MSNPLTRLLGVDVPLVLAPFGGLSSVELTATVSELGGLGSFGLYGFDAERIRTAVSGIRAVTDRPFALNLWLPTGDEHDPSPGQFAEARDALAAFYREVEVPLPERPRRFLPAFDEQFETVLELAPAAVSFVYGVPPASVVSRAHDRGIAVIGTATTVDEARALEAGGADAVVATGAEAAGHRTSFLAPAERSLVGTFSLVPQAADAVAVPVIAAGGVADRRGVAAAFALGADGVQVGTAFLHTRQSAAGDAHRAAIRATPAHESVLTRAMSGRLARGAANRAVREIEHADAIAPFPVQNWLTGRFRGPAGARGVGELQSLWLGQSAPLVHHDDARELFAELAEGIPPQPGAPG